MNATKLEWIGFSPCRYVLQTCLGAGFLIYLLCTGCAVVGVNNYQSAETLGQGKFKVGAAFEGGREMAAGIRTEHGNIEIEDSLNMDDCRCLLLELAGQYGITPSTDIGLAINGAFESEGVVISLKQNLVQRPDNFAVALMVKGGNFGSDIESHSSWGNSSTKENDTYRGLLLDIPVIISKRWNFLSIQVSPKYMYHKLEIETDYKKYRSGSLVEHNSDEETFEFHTIGVTTGFSFSGIPVDLYLISLNSEISFEVSLLRVKNLPEDSYQWISFPGVGVYVKFR